MKKTRDVYDMHKILYIGLKVCARFAIGIRYHGMLSVWHGTVCMVYLQLLWRSFCSFFIMSLLKIGRHGLVWYDTHSGMGWYGVCIDLIDVFVWVLTLYGMVHPNQAVHVVWQTWSGYYFFLSVVIFIYFM